MKDCRRVCYLRLRLEALVLVIIFGFGVMSEVLTLFFLLMLAPLCNNSETTFS